MISLKVASILFMIARHANSAAFLDDEYIRTSECVSLKKIYEDIKIYRNKIELIKNNLMVNDIFQNNQLYIEQRLNNFIEKVFTDGSKLFEAEGRCDYYGNCRNEKSECSQHLISASDKVIYKESLEMLSNSLLYDYENKFKLVEESLVGILAKMNLTEMYAYLYFNQQKMLSSNIEEVMSSYWDNETDIFNKDVIYILENSMELVKCYEKLTKEISNFENSVMSDVHLRKLKYACCLNGFNNDIITTSCSNYTKLKIAGLPDKDQNKNSMEDDYS